MRFVITAQSIPDKATPDPQARFDADLFKACKRFNEAMHQAAVLVASEGLPPDLLRLIEEAAPTWSAAVWQRRGAA